MKVLIIGSKGFIGTHLSEFFLLKGHNVYQADVVTDYTQESHYFLIDSTNSDYKIIFQNNAFDICINCSGAASVPQSLDNPHRDFTLNTSNVFKILDAIRQTQPACKFINLSSAAVYGSPTRQPISENTMCNPMSPYGMHKLMSESICKEFSTHFGLSTCSLRIFSAFGDGLAKQLFWDIAKKAALSNSIELYGTGQESRDFIYILDLVEAIDCIVENAEFNGQTINIANGEEHTIKEVASLFLANFKDNKEIVFGGQIREGDPINWKADISKLKRLGYSPKHSLVKGLKNYHSWLIYKGYIS